MSLSKLKTFAEDKLNFSPNIEIVFDQVENIVGKGESAGPLHFLLFLFIFFFPKSLFALGCPKLLLRDKGLNYRFEGFILLI